MYKIEVHNFVSQILQLFYRFGFWDKYNGVLEFSLKLFHSLYTLSFLSSIFAGAYSINDKNESIYLMAAGFAVFVNYIRMNKMIVGKKSFIAFLQHFCCHSTCDAIEFDQINDKLKTFVKVATSFCLVLAFAGACAVILPVVSREKILIVNIAFPLDWRNSEFSFWIAYTFVTGGVVYVLISLLVSIIIWYVMFNCSIKYEVLGNQLRKLGVLEIVSNTSVLEMMDVLEKDNHKSFQKDLIEAIKCHRNINRMVDQFSECFEDLFFIQIGTSGICICGSIYSLLFNLDDQSLFQNTVYCIFIVYSLFDIFVLMLLGNKIKESSDRLMYCLFQSDWIDEPHECKKLFLIMTEVLKHPKEIVVYKLYPLNLETFTSILHGAYNMFNLLKNLK